jgi:hypothetical protein
MRFVIGLLTVAAIITAPVAPVVAVANTFACCTPEGSCEDVTLPTCEGLNGIPVPGTTCADSPCNVMVPAASPAAMFVLITALLTLAIYALMRRASRE